MTSKNFLKTLIWINSEMMSYEWFLDILYNFFSYWQWTDITFTKAKQLLSVKHANFPVTHTDPKDLLIDFFFFSHSIPLISLRTLKLPHIIPNPWNNSRWVWTQSLPISVWWLHFHVDWTGHGVRAYTMSSGRSYLQTSATITWPHTDRTVTLMRISYLFCYKYVCFLFMFLFSFLSIPLSWNIGCINFISWYLSIVNLM